MASALYVGNDNVLEVDGLKNAVADTYINNATVSVILVDKNGEQVEGDTWPKTMDYVADSDGKYRCTLKDTLSLSPMEAYTATITADGGADLKGYWEFALRSATRT